uniref:Uncharacterized protein n=1 Tax=Anguilla anguilla TaxID=7936 RepID=A0A0E9SQF9_ANGAN
MVVMGWTLTRLGNMSNLLLTRSETHLHA